MMTQHPDPLNKTRQAALRFLSRRDYSQQELKQKLLACGHAGDLIQSILSELEQTGLLNDLRMAENYIHSRRHKGYGPQRITKELRIRGVPTEIIAEVVEITDNSWLAEAHKLWQKRFKGKIPSDFKSRAQQMRFLQYRGFTLEQIESVIPRTKFD